MRISVGFFIALILSIFAISPASARAQALTPEQKAALTQELAQVEAEQKQAAAELANAQAQSASLSRDITILDAKIKAAQLDIRAKNLLIQTLGNDITNKQKHINDLEAHITKGKETLSVVMRKINELDTYSLPEIVLSQSSVSGFYGDFDTFQQVEDGLKDTFNTLRSDQASTTAEKNALDQRRNAEMDARHSIEVLQANIKKDQATKQQLLAVSKTNEKSYATVIAQKQARAAQIRAQLFALRDAAAIPFGQALQYATLASQKTGVRPAFILAVITQESALGKNVGTCYVTNLQTGDGVYAKTGTFVSKVMHPTRDIPPFKTIMAGLGGDPTKQVVSCPLEIGWGGAMGPAQFIASTWVLFQDRIATAVGISGEPDPWNPAHAFMASAIYLSDLGASARTYSAERNAACKYYSGKSCGLIKGNTTYGNSVVAKADSIQRDMIDPLQGL
jgi:membrane-bound lytic murein transglycosylase B